MKTIKIREIRIYKVTCSFKNDKINPDMLRYDSCYACDDYPDLVAYLNDTKPTDARWRSFQQKLTFVEEASFINPERWYSVVNTGWYSGLVNVFLKDEKRYGEPVRFEFACKPNLAVYK